MNPERIYAESAAWPFWSTQAFHNRVNSLLWSEAEKRDDVASTLNAFSNFILPKGRGASPNQVFRFAESAWLGTIDNFHRQHPKGRVDLDIYLRRLAMCHLRWEGGRITPALPIEADSSSLIRRWRFLSALMPTDLLTAALSVEHSSSPPSRVTVLPGLLRNMLNERPVAQVHMHLKSAIPFELVWINAVHQFWRQSPTWLGERETQPITDSSNPFGSRDILTRWVGAAAVVRVVLALFLSRRSPNESLDSFLTRVRNHPGSSAMDWRIFCRCWAAFWSAQTPPSLSDIHGTLQFLLRSRRPRRSAPRNLEQLLEQDPVRWLLQGGQSTVAPEQALISHALQYIASNRDDTTFTTAFWQMVRIRTILYRYLTQAPGVSGLLWFTRFFERVRNVRRGMNLEMVTEAALRLEQEDIYFGSFEARISPEKTSYDFVKEVEAFTRGCNNALRHHQRPSHHSQVECGVVVHFNKRVEEVPLWHRHCGGMRLELDYTNLLQEATALCSALDAKPRILNYFRGLDVCGAEQTLPTWLFVAPIHKVREHARRVAARHRTLNLPGLALTVHAGEDFTRLADGLRRVHEVVHFLGLEHGDRLGHALALGVDPQHWCQKYQRMAQPAEERLDDLMWELQIYRSGDVPDVHGRSSYLRSEIHSIASKIYLCDDINIDALLHARTLRHRVHPIAFHQQNIYRGLLTRPRGTNPWYLLALYLFDGGVVRRGLAPIEVIANKAEASAMADIQKWLRTRLSHAGIVIEGNPSSNLFIGDTPIHEHPVCRLHPIPNHDPAGGEQLMVALGDDNPLTFATRLADEYAYSYYALLHTGVSTQKALSWIDAVRENGWRSRFTVPAPLGGSKLF